MALNVIQKSATGSFRGSGPSGSLAILASGRSGIRLGGGAEAAAPMLRPAMTASDVAMAVSLTGGASGSTGVGKGRGSGADGRRRRRGSTGDDGGAVEGVGGGCALHPAGAARARLLESSRRGGFSCRAADFGDGGTCCSCLGTRPARRYPANTSIFTRASRRESSSSEHSGLGHLDGEGSPGRHLGLAHGRPQLLVDRGRRLGEDLADLPVRPSGYHQPDHLPLTGREPVSIPPSGRRARAGAPSAPSWRSR